MEKYKIYQTIGEGGYCHFHKAYNCETNKIVALKEIQLLDSNEGIPSSAIREISLLKEMEHSNIVRLLDIVSDKKTVYLVLEHMSLDLKTFMVENPMISKDPRMIKRFLHQLLSGLAYCHSYQILPQDLKPENLVIDCSKRILKLADFGSARAFGVSSRAYIAGGKAATRLYSAPELLLGNQNSSTAVDMWSVGCIFAEMIIRYPLFTAPTENLLMIQILSILGKPNEETWPGVNSLCDSLRNCAKNQPQFLTRQVPLDTFDKEEPKNLAVVVPGLDEAGIDLLSRMLCLNPRGRISASEALNHPYFQNI